MFVMAVYNFIIYLSLNDKTYLYYVLVAVFNILTLGTLSGLGSQFIWTGSTHLDMILYVAFAGVSMFFTSLFTIEFLQLKVRSSRLFKVALAFGVASLVMSAVSLIAPPSVTEVFGRLLVLTMFPVFITIGFVIYRQGFKPAGVNVFAWIPYTLSLVLAILRVVEFVPEGIISNHILELGGSFEIVIFSFALAFRIKKMREDLVVKEIEKEQIKTAMLEERKVFLELEVEERTKELKQANATKDKFFSIIAHDL